MYNDNFMMTTDLTATAADVLIRNTFNQNTCECDGNQITYSLLT